jgi:hypothetical protein
MTGAVVRPGAELETTELKMEQTAPGRYEGTFPARDSGSYFIIVNPGTGQVPIRTGVDIPYSDEFRARSTNLALLRLLASLVPKGGGMGQWIQGPADFRDVRPYLAVNSFRHDLAGARSSQEIWHYLVLAASCLFFFDVFVRRVQVGFGWMPRLAGRLRDRVLGRKAEPEPIEVMERLRTSKAEADDRLEQLRVSARFEGSSEAGDDADIVVQLQPPPGGTRLQKPSLVQEPEDESYTERLLRAKKQAWKKRKDG